LNFRFNWRMGEELDYMDGDWFLLGISC